MILSVQGDSLTLPFVSLANDGGTSLKLKLTHMLHGLKKTETFEMTRTELKLVALAVFNAMENWND